MKNRGLVSSTTTLQELLDNVAADPPALAGETGERACHELWQGYADRFVTA